jgi:hypothetical protein
MGAGASLTTLSAQDVATEVGKLGEEYNPYVEIFLRHGIDGHILHSIPDDEVMPFLQQIGITSEIHRKLLGLHLAKLIPKSATCTPVGNDAVTSQPDNPSTVSASSTSSDSSKRHGATLPPSTILSKIFAFQGIHLVDLDDMASIVGKITSVTGPSQCNGDDTFDCFISYRVASEKEVAEKLYLHLKTQGLHPFLDRMCLRNGEPWKDGFLRGLLQSRVFLTLVSQAGLAKARDRALDHRQDNLLLEYEHALELANTNQLKIFPIYVATVGVDGGLVKFQGTIFILLRIQRKHTMLIILIRAR